MPREIFSHRRAEPEAATNFWLKPRRLTAWVGNPAAFGGLKPFSVKATVSAAQAQLPLPATAKWPLGVWDTEVLAHGSMTVSLFTPKETDFQTPHEQDELYIIVTGSGEFVCDGQPYDFAPGDALFVPAGVEHRFTRFTPDFAAWVIFYGPKGGEVGE